MNSPDSLVWVLGCSEQVWKEDGEQEGFVLERRSLKRRKDFIATCWKILGLLLSLCLFMKMLDDENLSCSYYLLVGVLIVDIMRG